LKPKSHRYAADVVVAIGLGVAGNMTWDAAKAVVEYLYRRGRALATKGQEPTIRLEDARIKRPGFLIEGLTIKGSANDATATHIIGALTRED
jgi:hypothetical protein